MTRDSGNLSIDFLVGFTIFLLAFIWVVSMIPGLLINLQGYTIDYDAVAYRTGVILAEDPGEPALPSFPWETLSKKDVVRFGLAVSRNTPNILSRNKVDKFFCSSVFSYPDDYQQRAIFGDYNYTFNISLTDSGKNMTQSVGDIMSGNYGSIRRLVKIKEQSYATINSTKYMNGDNETLHEFSILFNNTELLKDKVRDPLYQIDPAREKITINITDLNSTLYPDRQGCFNINLTKIYAKDPAFIRIQLFTEPVIDGIQYDEINTEGMYATLPFVKNNISLTVDPSFIPWSNYPQVYLTLSFNLVKNASIPGCLAYNGSRFFNNSLTSAFDYNYTSDSVKQPELRDGVLEVKTGSGYRTISTLTELIAAKFKYEILSGTPKFTVKFTDQSTGLPVDWEWDFTNDGTIDSSLNNPTKDYNAAGKYTVNLTVKDASGASAFITKTIDLSKPNASFTLSPATGIAPLVVTFTDTSTGGAPTTWDWDFGDASLHSTVQNPSYAYTVAGTYTANLTVSNIFGSSSATNTITVIPPAPVADFNTTPSPATGNAPLVVTFTDTSTGGTPTIWDWDFGDASPHSYNVTSIAHTYNVAGSYTAQLTVSNAGGSSSTTKPVSVGIFVGPPVAAFSGTPVSGNAPLNVQFTDASTGSITAYAWDFNNDGTIDSTSPSPSYTYATAGTYTVNLTVTGPGGSDVELKTSYITVYTILSFTTNGTWTAPAGITSVEYLVVAGGGAGGAYGAGGGAGGFRTAPGYAVTPMTSYTVTIGAGGVGGAGRGGNGGNSAFATITATGGGGGGGSGTNDGNNGGSGGGARSGGAIGTGIAGQGNKGGLGYTGGTTRLGGGGGGASVAGGNATSTNPGAGGAGSSSSITGTATQYTGGGGGGGNLGTGGSGGAGGGGAGSISGAGTAGTANTGGGGGGSASGFNGSNGGSGIVIIKFH